MPRGISPAEAASALRRISRRVVGVVRVVNAPFQVMTVAVVDASMVSSTYFRSARNARCFGSGCRERSSMTMISLVGTGMATAASCSVAATLSRTTPRLTAEKFVISTGCPSIVTTKSSRVRPSIAC